LDPKKGVYIGTYSKFFRRILEGPNLRGLKGRFGGLFKTFSFGVTILGRIGVVHLEVSSIIP